MIHDCENRIKAVTWWKMCNQIKGDHLKQVCRWGYRDLVERRLLGMGQRFVLLADPTSLDIFYDPLPHPWPLIVFGYFFVGLVSSQVPPNW